jgi:hypothetical protein
MAVKKLGMLEQTLEKDKNFAYEDGDHYNDW